jgi:uncharacterized protein YeaO (DUF488 family)
VIKVKSLFDKVEADDGVRLFVEPVGLTRDLIEWCEVHHALSNVAPPRKLAQFLDGRPERYATFRGQYHEWLAGSKFVPALNELANASLSENYTLLHTGDDAERNVATALAEYLTERQGWKNAT